MLVPEILFAPARGARLAYQTWGEGEQTLVAIPPFAQHIEMAWEQPAVRAMLERFGSFSRYLHFDKRGTGSSDRRSQVPGIDERVEDLRAVMDAAEIDQAHFFAQSDGGPMAILFAVTYPHRVQSLTLYGTAAFLGNHDQSEEERLARRDMQVALWGTPQSLMVDFFAPSWAGDDEYRTWHQRYERTAASTDELRELLDLAAEMDVTEVLGAIDVPTLVLHNSGDLVVPVERGKYLAEHIPGARLIEYERIDHFAYVGDLDPWMSDVEAFVTGSTKPRPNGPKDRIVRIVTLGRFAVEVNGEELDPSAWGSRLSRQLCKRLVAARGWPVTRDELIDMMWPDEGDRRKLSARLSVHLSAVRRILGGGVIANRENIRLDLDEISTDLETFYQADEDSIPSAYPGDFLPDDVYEDWAEAPRSEARTRFVSTARRLAAASLKAGETERAITVARQLVATDPYDETAHALLVDSLRASSNVSEARRAHATWEKAMAELDISIAPFTP